MKKILSLFTGILFLISTSLYASDWRIESPWTKSGTTISQSTPGDNVNINATFGAELSPAYTGASGVNWTLGAGWETPIAGGVLNKNVDGVGTATPTGATAIVVGVTYKVVITPNITVETFSYTLGGVLGSSIVGASVIIDYITAITTGNLIITPTNLSRGTVTVSWKALTNVTGDLTVEGNLNIRSPSTFDSQITLRKGQLLLPNGSAAVPSLAFTNAPNSGFYAIGDLVAMTVGGVLIMYADNSLPGYALTLPANNWLTWGGDTILLRDGAANTLALRNGNNDQKQRWYGANGSYFQIATQSELLTIAAAPSTPTTMSIPANAIVRGVAVYVVTVIPTAATFTVTGTTSATVFNTAAVGVAAGSNDVGTQNTPYKNGAAQTITITPNVQPAAATGQVRIVLMYEIPSAPTS